MIRRVFIFISAAWLLIGSTGQVSADSVLLSIGHFQYGYEPSGKPFVHLMLNNQGTMQANPSVRVTFRMAYSSSQDAYRYRKRGATKPVAVVLAPGQKRQIALPVGKLLPYGDYEAIVSVNDKGMQSQERFEFSVREEDVQEARLHLRANHIEGYADKPFESWRKCLLYGVVAILVISLVAVPVIRRIIGRREAK